MNKTMENHLLRDRRGITPLMATFLLISLAVAVGVVVMNFGRAQVEENAECPVDIGLKFAEIGGKQQICYDKLKKALTFTLENGVNIKVDGLIVNIVEVEAAQAHDVDANIIKAGTYLGKVPTAGSAIRQVKIIPKVTLYDEQQICPEKALIIEQVGNC